MAYQSKFVSVNLNKSYGRNSSSSSSSAFRDGRSRSGSGGGMAPVSLPRSSSSSVSKPTTRLAVPPPLNLPSLRKEHERFDPASSGAAAGHGTSGLGSGSGSSGMGWSKPIVTAPSAEDAVIAVQAQSQLGRSTGSSDRLPGSAYMPPGSRVGSQLLPAAPAQVFTDKAVILRGEDFPSLHATALALKLKEQSSQKQKQKQIGEDQQERRAELSESRAPIEMRPQMRSSRLISYNASDGNGSSNIQSGASELSQKNDSYFPGPLPLVRFKHTSDWADDERDTGLSLPERARDRGFSKFESDDERNSAPSGELFKGDSFRKDVKPAVSGIRDFGSWRSPLPSRDRLDTREVGVDKDRYDSRPSSASKEVGQPPLGENGRDGYTHGNHDSRYPRRDIGSHINTQGSKAPAEIFSGRSTEQNGRVRYADRSNNWYKGNPFQNNTIAKSHLSSVNKGTSFMTNFNKEKRSVPSAGKSYIEDTGFDSMDPFSSGICDVNLKVSKKKKDMLNQSYFHDPERESFEAELERILMAQEQERKRIMEEQAKVLDLARKEKEERERLAREEEERRWLLEKEAREAAWRAEQEKLEAARRADEQRIAREEERKRYQVEEERRKEAARQKLLELEARIARRQVEEKPNDNELPSADGDRVPLSARERDIPQISNLRDWEDGERMMENVATLVSSDTLGMNNNLDASRSQFSKHGNLSSMDFGNHSHYGSSLLIQDQAHNNPRRDVSGSRSGPYKKELHGSLSALRSSSRGGTSESAETLGEYRQPRQQRWNISTDGDHFRKNSYLDDDLHDNEKFDEVGYGHSNSHGSPHTSFDERSLQNFQVDEFSSFTRYRQFLRQPHVPPPPSLTSMQRNSFRGPVERENSSFVNDKTHPRHSSKTGLQSSQLGYDSSYHDILQQISVTSLEENVLHSEQIQQKINSRRDSVSSLSVSSAPSSPAPLLHDEMDTTGDSPALPTSADGERTILSDNEYLAPTMQADSLNRMTTSGSVSPREDDAWGTGNHDVVHGQEYYDEEEGDYQEVDEVHECADSNLDLEQKLEDSHSDGQTANGEMEQVILGFDDGVEVKIPMNNDIDMASRNSDKETMQQAGHPGIENLVSHGNNTLPEVSLDDSLSVMENTEKAMQNLVLDPIRTSYPVSTPEETPTPLILPQHIISAAPSIKQLSASSTSSNISSSATTSHGVTPVDLQFGLFSGPSLIPSPVPAIQIGSIQMPIHVHTQISPSQPRLFQFGLLRYPPPISQNILPLAPQNMSFIPPHVQAPFSFTQNHADFLYKQAPQDLSQSKSRDAEPSCMSDNQSGLPPHVGYEQLNASPDHVKNVAAASHSQTERCSIAEQNTIDFVSHQNDGMPATKCHKAIAGNKNYEDQQHAEFLNSQSSVANAHTKAQGILSANREKKDSYSEQNYSSLSFPRAEVLRNVSSGFQRRPRRNTHRTEFRVRESAKKRQISGMELLDNVEQDEKSNIYGRTSAVSVRNFGKRDVALNRSFNKTESDDTNLGSSSPRSSDVKTFKATQKDYASKNLTPFVKSSAAKSNLNSEEDVDAPLQSGIVRVFKQPGIETPSDEDDFIEVRSKRQMLNNRREQREKENKSRSKVLKIPRKQRTSPQDNAAISNSNKTAMSSGADASKHARSSSLVTIRRDPSKHDPSLAFIPNVSQTLSPIGTPLSSADPEARSGDLKSSQVTSYPAESNEMIKCSPTVVLENKVAAAENPSLSLNSWDNENDTRQVMALTQTQLDEAMKPAQFDSHLDSNVCLEPKAISSIMSQQKSFPSCASPISSLLAGEKIQFGAVTSPTILPLNRAVTSGLSPPGSSRSEVKTSQTLVTTNNQDVMFFGKEKHHGAAFTNLEDPEAEAEAAASAVAVAAISNDEIVTSGVGGSLVSATSDNKSFSTADVTGFTSGGGLVSQEASGASVGGESLSVALPADLSVDTSSLSLWPPLPSPQSSGHMLSHFPGAPPSHFPCFDMNSVLGGHVFAYGPNDESVVSQEQSQRSASLASGPLGAWPQCHSGVDSFYGPPTGFGPFINPGGIPGVQGPSHMVVYNHFAPVGRFGQVGLSFMGTYIPTGNQTEQKQNEVSSAVGEGKVDCQNGNASMQGTSPGMPAPIQNLGGGSSLMPVSGQGPMPSMPAIQHLGPGSPLMPMASPLTMFDITPFQSSAGIPMQARWSHVPAPALHSVPIPIPPKQHHGEGGMSTQFNQSLSIDTSVASNRFRDSHSSLPVGVSRDLPAPSSAASHFPQELALLEQQISATGGTQSVRSSFNGNGNNIKVTKSATRTTVTGMSDNGSIGANSSTSSSQNTANKFKQPPSSGHQYLNSGHLSKQGGAAQKNVSGGEWHRGIGFHGRNQISGSDKNTGSSKMKQIYVAKPSTSVSSSQAR